MKHTDKPTKTASARPDNVRELRDALLHPYRDNYEAIRAELIALLGYEAFRDMQSGIFRDMTASAPETRKGHAWNEIGFCVYCNNVHRTDSNARSTCSDGFSCTIPAEKPILNALLDASESFADIPSEKPTVWHGAYDSEGKLRATFDSESEAYHYVRNRGHMHGGSDKPITAPDWKLEAYKKRDQLIRLEAQAAQLAETLRAFLKVVRTSNIDRSATHEGLTNCDAISVASQALAAYESEVR